MKAASIRGIWLGTDHPWRPWVKEPLFSSLSSTLVATAEEGAFRGESSPWSGQNLPPLGEGKVALFIDLPGPGAVEMGLIAGARGFRPVLSMNASSADEEVIDMKPVLSLLVKGARFRGSFPSGPNIAPAFILDSRRTGGRTAPAPGGFDNRWTLFASDLPSGDHLKTAGIDAAVIVQQTLAPMEDLRAICETYQRAGLEVRIANVHEQTLTVMPEEHTGWLTAITRTIRLRFALNRRWDGSYGYRVPIPPEPSHG